MKTKMVLIISAIVLSFGFGDCFAANSKITELVDKLPADNAEQENLVIGKLAEFGAEGIGEICGMLLPVGGGDDNRARYAISGMTRYVMRDGAENERVGCADKLQVHALVVGFLETQHVARIRFFRVRERPCLIFEQC